MQLYESIALRDAWWNICCPQCKEPMPENPYRDVRITWSEVLGIAIDLWGKPDGFFVRDFLISLELEGGKAMLTFCSQGSRRGEVQVSVPAGDGEAGELKKAFMDRVRAVIEAQPAPVEREDYYDDDDEYEDDLGYYEGEPLF